MDEEELRNTAMALRRSTTQLARRLRARRPAGGPGRLGLSLLGHLFRRGPLTPGDLASAERLQPQSVTRALASLEANGLIERATNPADRRQAHITLTERGRHTLTEEMRTGDDWLARRLAEALSPTEQRVVGLASELLARIAEP
ncbi:MAG TPA: MarR family transcriptional regulator [Amycolatopsis sp.]|nr:MarR family transcriptional regulator [Amycolatopsis sp.]